MHLRLLQQKKRALPGEEQIHYDRQYLTDAVSHVNKSAARAFAALVILSDLHLKRFVALPPQVVNGDFVEETCVSTKILKLFFQLLLSMGNGKLVSEKPERVILVRIQRIIGAARFGSNRCVCENRPGLVLEIHNDLLERICVLRLKENGIMHRIFRPEILFVHRLHALVREDLKRLQNALHVQFPLGILFISLNLPRITNLP